MKFINNNPYRILGLPVTATDRQITKRASDLSVYAEMGKAKTYEYDFDDLAHLDRSPNAIGYATRQLEQPKDKLIHSIFWLNYDSKENYLQQLNNDNFSEALENFPNSTVQNLQNKAVLTLFPYVNKGELKRGIKYFDKFLTHPKINNFISEIVGERSAQHFGLYDLFIAQILPYLMKKLESNELLSIFNSTSKAEYVKGKLVRPIVNNIESEIKTTNNKTNSEPTNAYKFGKELIDNTAEKLTELKSILLVSDLKYTSISNKLAEQILYCSVAYFNSKIKAISANIEKTTVLKNTLEIANTTKIIAKSSVILQRIDESIKTLEKMKYQDGFNAVNFLNSIIEAYEKIDKENRIKPMNFLVNIKTINEEKVLIDLKDVVKPKIVEKIAKSNIEELIYDFNCNINGVINKMKQSAYAKKLKSEFLKHLPNTNPIKKEHTIKLYNEMIEKKEIELEKVRGKTFFLKKLEILENEKKNIEKWKLFRTKKTKELQVNKKNREIKKLKANSDKKKEEEIARIEKELEQKKNQMKIYKKTGVLK